MSETESPMAALTASDSEIALFGKYDVPVPRYTSYPSVPYWTGLSETSWEHELAARVASGVRDTALYVHVPYCRTLCAFCGCTRVVSRDKSAAPSFIEALLREARRRTDALPARLRAKELHVGGGTPTWLSADEMVALFEPLLSLFDRDADDFSFSIEVDPRTLTEAHVAAFVRLGVNRVSLGVQDFHEPTMRAIRRIQPREMVETAVEWLRAAGITDINFDLVYGLPGQTPESIAATVDHVLAMRPTRIANYAYAHVPALRANQNLVERSGTIPTGIDKHRLAETARARFKRAGYREIGFDHFALPEDSLWRAFERGALHRNFMGYTDTQAPILLGFGPSSLSDCGTAYAQNEKEPKAWMEAVREGRPLITRGHLLSESDRELRSLVLDLMCGLRASVPRLIFAQPELRAKLASLSSDGLIEVNEVEARVDVTSSGMLFLRNIAAAFDPYLRSPQASSVTHSRA